MSFDPTGRYKGNNFDPNYAAKRKAKMEQQQQYPQRFRKDNYDQRPRDNGYNSRNERDGRGWQGPSSLDYGDSGTNSYSTPRRDTQWDNHGNRAPASSHRPHNTTSSGPQNPTRQQKSPASATPRTLGDTHIDSCSTDKRGLDAALKDLNDLVGLEPAALAANGTAGAGAATGPGELSSLEKLKLFKAQVEASRAARSTDASSTAITQVAESFLQRETSSNGAEPKTTPTNDKAQALKAKLKALKQQKGGSVKDNSQSKGQESASKAQAPSPQVAVAQSTTQSVAESGRPTTQSYADVARDHPRRRSASPRGRAASPTRYSRTEAPYRRANKEYADQPPEYSGPRNRRDEVVRYDRSNTETPRPTRATVIPHTPMPVSSTSINLVVKTLEVIKAQVEQLEVLIQPILDSQAAGDSSPAVRQLAPATEMPPPPAPTHQRRSSFDSYEQSMYKRRSTYYDDDDGGYNRSTPTRGGYQKSRGGAGGGRGGYNHRKYDYEGRDGYKRY